MQNLLILLSRYGAAILFVLLEIFCFFLIVNYNNSQKDIFVNSSKLFSGYLLDKKENLNSYFGLREVNEKLHNDNARLLQKTFNITKIDTTVSKIRRDSSYRYEVIPARVISKSGISRNKVFTINKGERHGLHKGLGVITSSGIAGVLKSVSKNYAQVMTILHSQSRISVRIKRNNYHGNLLWNGMDPTILELDAIPKHADLIKGDTIVSSGYSSIFPADIVIGQIENFEVPKGNSNYSIDVKVFADIPKLSNVFIIKDLHKTELDSLNNVTAYEN